MLRACGFGRFVFALACSLSVAIASAEASAKPRKRGASASDAQIEAQARTQTLEPERNFGTPAKFFTINQVLAKVDSGQAPKDPNAAPGPADRRLASLPNGNQQSDAPLRGSIPQIGEDPFGLYTFRAPDGILWRKWRGVEAEIAAEMKEIAACQLNAERCSPAAQRFLKIVEAVKAREGRARIEEANRDVNAVIRYVSDMAQHAEPDRWTAPLATLAAGRGDCEDYAIAKYIVLREAGMALADMKLVLVRDRAARDDHAVLAVRHDNRWLVLDNRRAFLNEDMELKHFVPLFALDHDGVKLFAAPYAKKPEGSVVAPTPAAWLDGDEFPLRGRLAADGAGSAGYVVPLAY